MGWGGDGKGKGGWAPVWQAAFQKGGNWGKGSNWGKGGGKGKDRSHREFHPESKAWIGSLPPTVTFKELFPRMKQAGNCKWAECFEGNGKGTSFACRQYCCRRQGWCYYRSLVER